MLAQLAPPTATDLEHWLLPAAAVLWLAGQWKKVFPARRNDDSFVTKTELAHELSALTDKIDARFLALSEKLDTMSDRINKLATAVARIDERTKPHTVVPADISRR
jgi:hypothetical protein